MYWDVRAQTAHLDATGGGCYAASYSNLVLGCPLQTVEQSHGGESNTSGLEAGKGNRFAKTEIGQEIDQELVAKKSLFKKLLLIIFENNKSLQLSKTSSQFPSRIQNYDLLFK